MTASSNYLDSPVGLELIPTRTRLLFAARLHHGPGHVEEVQYRIGPSRCGRYDVLWTFGDWDEEGVKNALAWTPRHVRRGQPLHRHLLASLFQAENTTGHAEAPPFSEVKSSPPALLPSELVWAVVGEVFASGK